MTDLNRGKLCALKMLLQGNSQIDPDSAAAVIGDVLIDEAFEDGELDYDDIDPDDDRKGAR